MSAVLAEDGWMTIYRRLMWAARQESDGHLLAAMLADHWRGSGAMPERLGLDEAMFERMMEYHFPGIERPAAALQARPWDVASMPEYAELKSLLTDCQAVHLRDQPWWIDILIAGCSGHSHLWEDLGLFSRHDLNLLMHTHFPLLAAKNDRDMKWKKFIYKQLCEREGIIACPAPTCDACAQFSECFAPEE
jgi:nitrogen fixation protein NifQ